MSLLLKLLTTLVRISKVECDLKLDMFLHFSTKINFADRKARILDLNVPRQKCSKKKTSSSESLILSPTQTQQFHSREERTWEWKQVQRGEQDGEAHGSNFLCELAKGP